MKAIASRDNPQFKSIRKLAEDGRERRRQARTLLDGIHLVAAYQQKIGRPELLLLSESGHADREIVRLVDTLHGVPGLLLRDALFAELSETAAPAGILAVIAIPPEPAADGAALAGDCIMLDAVQDAGNLGAILRSAAAAGVKRAFLGVGCAGAWSPRVLRGAQGAHFDLRIHEHADLAALIARLRATSVAADTAGGTCLYDADLRGSMAWLFGNEGAGIRPELAQACRLRLTIPLAAGSESLNVAAAASVCLFEAVRQRRGGKAAKTSAGPA